VVMEAAVVVADTNRTPHIILKLLIIIDYIYLLVCNK